MTEAAADEEVRAKLSAVLAGVTGAIEERLRRARAQGELSPDADVAGLAGIASAVLHSLAVQVRAGVPRAQLLATVRSTVELICSP